MEQSTISTLELVLVLASLFQAFGVIATVVWAVYIWNQKWKQENRDEVVRMAMNLELHMSYDFHITEKFKEFNENLNGDYYECLRVFRTSEQFGEIQSFLDRREAFATFLLYSGNKKERIFLAHRIFQNSLVSDWNICRKYILARRKQSKNYTIFEDFEKLMVEFEALNIS